MTSVLVNVLVLSLFAVERLILRFKDFVSLVLCLAALCFLLYYYNNPHYRLYSALLLLRIPAQHALHSSRLRSPLLFLLVFVVAALVMPRTTRGKAAQRANAEYTRNSKITASTNAVPSDESIASDVYAAIKQGMREQRKDASFHIIKKYHNIVFKII
ncbi:predicted protein [Pyrenophora tritici-repentis Pt-1C-BFP]|uniref:Uncharacterized protein n=1 Tax=Pyrenophora tritici-repentis (strain Pt-1C-BFP) TaxID=426418 RepID=B2WMY5_PYRTR|nr:uncharacterized protein PTRG_11345 [Pyrenophora tritici-repentis Pt-1C-BFP]EDU44395.1 predicted protein [Pyrenophora tritici-repentis Pt-1C-BFP]